MIKIRWIITDEIENVSLEEFNVEWNGIYGYFEMHIHNRFLGFCPERKLLDGEEGNENILYWISKLSEGIVQSKADGEYKIQLLSMNLCTICIKKTDNIIMRFKETEGDDIWIEEIEIQEFCNEMLINIEKFLLEVQEHNTNLLGSNLIKRLIELKEKVECFY